MPMQTGVDGAGAGQRLEPALAAAEHAGALASQRAQHLGFGEPTAGGGLAGEIVDRPAGDRWNRLQQTTRRGRR